MFYRVVVIGWMLSGLSVSGQTSDPEGKFPWLGQLTGQKVNVRSGPGRNYYVSGRLAKGAQVAVVSERYGWFEIQPPEGFFSLISHEFVVRGEGKQGAVKGKRVRVRAGSTISKQKYKVQLMLDAPREVTILGEEGKYYRIVPPKGATLWVSARFVKRVAGLTEATIVRKKKAPDPESKNVTRYRELEIQYAKQQALPIVKQDLSGLRGNYQQLLGQTKSAYLLRNCRRRIKKIDNAIAAGELARKIQKIAREYEADKKRFSAELARTRRTPPAVSRPPLPTIGRLRSSVLYLKRPSPIRYRLTHPQTDETIALVVPARDGVHCKALLGKVVEVYGERKYDAGLRMFLIHTERIKARSDHQP